jgi:hypothetical protein
MTFDKYIAWSSLDNKPVLVHLPKHDDCIVFWKGVQLTHLAALNIAMERFGIFPTPKMLGHIEDNYRLLYQSNAFGHRDWDHILCDNINNRAYPYLRNLMHEKAHNFQEKYTAMDVMDWFDYSNASETDDVS